MLVAKLPGSMYATQATKAGPRNGSTRARPRRRLRSSSTSPAVRTVPTSPTPMVPSTGLTSYLVASVLPTSVGAPGGQPDPSCGQQEQCGSVHAAALPAAPSPASAAQQESPRQDARPS